MIKIYSILEKSWSEETCVPSSKTKWSKDNPSLGQCAITALVVNDFIGGKIMRCMCGNESHYYNLVNGIIIDYTQEQFLGIMPDYEIGEERTREYLLSNEDTKNRYLLYLNKVKENFEKYGFKKYKLVNELGETFDSKIPGTLGGNRQQKIYGKLDCRCSLTYIKKGMYINNRVFFQDEETAIKAGYRPCGVCMKKEYKIWKNKK